METRAALERLAADELIRETEGRWRTTRRWQAAMMRAARRLSDEGDRGDDLRVAVAAALLELYGDALDDSEVSRLVVAILPIEQRELAPPAPLPGGA